MTGAWVGRDKRAEALRYGVRALEERARMAAWSEGLPLGRCVERLMVDLPCEGCQPNRSKAATPLEHVDTGFALLLGTGAPPVNFDWRFLVENDAPIEQYACLGLEQPQ
ncbi:MAG: hypothetical protein OXI90_05745 [Gammaproteobacteria bacterium]|nr:hypothetical protein [Gammaproteobacteria bacterium]